MQVETRFVGTDNQNMRELVPERELELSNSHCYKQDIEEDLKVHLIIQTCGLYSKINM